jgi:predicted dehydrogenase
VICEKPLARNLQEAKAMYLAARDAGITHMMISNYRFVPAIALAKRLIDNGKIGEIRHFNAVYYQDWLVNPDFPMVWRHDATSSGSGAHGDMNAHTVDLARYLIGEFEAVNGFQKTFIRERPLADGKGKGAVTTDDASLFLCRFRNGAVGSFTVSRFATGRKNFLRLEIFGSKGGLVFNLERLNELQYYSLDDDPESQGYKNILATEPMHPYMQAWWPPGHLIGWEHAFSHQVRELIGGIAGKKAVAPDFYDGYKCQQVLDAVMASDAKGSWIEIDHD